MSNIRALKVREGGLLEHSSIGKVDASTWADNIGRILTKSDRVETVMGWGHMDGTLCVLVDEFGNEAYYIHG